MKTNRTLFTLAAVALVIWATGCEKKDTTAQPDANKAVTDSGAAVKDSADAMKETSVKVAQDAKEAGQKVAKDVSAKTEELAAPINAKAQEIIDAAKKLVSDGKLQDALTKLKELGGQMLSAEQKTVADGLKAQIDKLLGTTSKATTDATKAAGNLIK
jgi:hypothetical protein